MPRRKKPFNVHDEAIKSAYIWFIAIVLLLTLIVQINVLIDGSLHR